MSVADVAACLLASCTNAPAEQETAPAAVQTQALTESIVDDTAAGAGGGPIAYRIGSALTVMHGHLIVTEGFQFQFVKERVERAACT